MNKTERPIVLLFTFDPFLHKIMQNKKKIATVNYATLKANGWAMNCT